ncbi:hypothetical protein AVEN_42613-1 [Araneus ventricosus]|uniref:Uncharacterized protein n=1 Tax=Araneus ventricosus TaxID=182803 RepID=A0A4Y2X9F3_ARAVE|nr:hypothetical protein AVEN_42613-1 [Araneus ventricosus]
MWPFDISEDIKKYSTKISRLNGNIQECGVLNIGNSQTSTCNKFPPPIREQSFHKRAGLLISDVSFTPEQIRGSGYSKGTTKSDSDRKERNRSFGFVNRNRIY